MDRKRELNISTDASKHGMQGVTLFLELKTWYTITGEPEWVDYIVTSLTLYPEEIKMLKQFIKKHEKELI